MPRPDCRSRPRRCWPRGSRLAEVGGDAASVAARFAPATGHALLAARRDRRPLRRPRTSSAAAAWAWSTPPTIRELDRKVALKLLHERRARGTRATARARACCARRRRWRGCRTRTSSPSTTRAPIDEPRVHRDGVRRRADAGRVAARPAPRSWREILRRLPRGRARARRRARGRARPPRLQARQRDGRRATARVRVIDFGLAREPARRPRRSAGGVAGARPRPMPRSDRSRSRAPARCSARRLHGARAVRGRGRRRAHRSVQLLRRAVRGALRRAARSRATRSRRSPTGRRRASVRAGATATRASRAGCAASCCAACAPSRERPLPLDGRAARGAGDAIRRAGGAARGGRGAARRWLLAASSASARSGCSSARRALCRGGGAARGASGARRTRRRAAPRTPSERRSSRRAAARRRRLERACRRARRYARAGRRMYTRRVRGDPRARRAVGRGAGPAHGLPRARRAEPARADRRARARGHAPWSARRSTPPTRCPPSSAAPTSRSLRAVPPPPRDPAARRAGREPAFSAPPQARALGDTGRWKGWGWRKRAPLARRGGRKLGYEPVVAEILVLLGVLGHLILGNVGGEESASERRASARCGQPRRPATTRSRRMRPRPAGRRSTGLRVVARYDESERWGRFADAHLQAHGSGPRTRLKGWLAQEPRGGPDEMPASWLPVSGIFKLAIELKRKADGGDSPGRGAIHELARRAARDAGGPITAAIEAHRSGAGHLRNCLRPRSSILVARGYSNRCEYLNSLSRHGEALAVLPKAARDPGSRRLDAITPGSVMR